MSPAREIAHGIELLAVPTATLPPASHTNSFALGTQEVLLVEPCAAFPKEQYRWIRWAKGLLDQGKRPTAIFLTHHHPDHAAGAQTLCHALGLPLWAHRETAQRIAPTPVDRLLDEGEEIFLDGPLPQRWRVLHTPGHAPGHLCLHEPTSQTLLLGDMVAGKGTIVIPPGEGNMAEYLEQLQRLEELDARLGLPAHGEPLFPPRSVLRNTYRLRRMREDKIKAALCKLSSPDVSLEKLLAEVYYDTSITLWPIAKLSLQAHLDKLEAEGFAQRVGNRRYCLKGESPVSSVDSQSY